MQLSAKGMRNQIFFLSATQTQLAPARLGDGLGHR